MKFQKEEGDGVGRKGGNRLGGKRGRMGKGTNGI